ncbi:MAG: heavy-metal-associated domain-containing protein [Candidatus Latescibacteria bacterium]|nr:heavy-metal-associated domain-containing protein [Candidatus Latescibacterota bacterium]
MGFGKSQKETLAVEGMSCAHCEHAVESGLKDIAGVVKARADHGKGQVEIFYKGQAPDWDAVRRKITDLGYTVK